MEKNFLNATQIYIYLNKKGLCDQVHLFRDGEMIFYHWNQVGSQLIDSLVVKNGRIHKLGYPRDIIPGMFKRIDVPIKNNFVPEKHKFVKEMKYER